MLSKMVRKQIAQWYPPDFMFGSYRVHYGHIFEY